MLHPETPDLDSASVKNYKAANILQKIFKRSYLPVRNVKQNFSLYETTNIHGPQRHRRQLSCTQPCRVLPTPSPARTSYARPTLPLSCLREPG